MSDCTWLSDRMPLVALGRTEWTADEIHHLSGCASCQREWDLLRAVSRLGERSAVEIDAPSVSRVLQQRLGWARRRKRQRKVWGVAGMAAAAALAGLLWSGQADPPFLPSSSAPAVAGLQIPLPELEDLQAAELDSVLRGMDQPVPDLDTLETTDPEAFESPELETVYDYWEG
jgi:hypothetical protein